MAAPGAQVQNPGSLPRFPCLEDAPLRQQLGVHPGDEHLPGDIQGQAVELPLPDDVGHRLPRQTALDQLLHPPLHLSRGIEHHIPVELLPCLVRREADNLPGLQLGGLHPRPLQAGPGVQK